jgi:hypothetical protein
MYGFEQSEIHGEKGTGFEKRGSKGPFQCGNCRYFDDGLCHQKTMGKESKQPRRDGYPEVGLEDCCEYIERRG